MASEQFFRALREERRLPLLREQFGRPLREEFNLRNMGKSFALGLTTAFLLADAIRNGYTGALNSSSKLLGFVFVCYIFNIGPQNIRNLVDHKAFTAGLVMGLVVYKTREAFFPPEPPSLSSYSL